jgi:hypothetical protein
VQKLINTAMIADSKLLESGEIACKRFWVEIVQIL